jgi:hypothetical protein
MSTSNLTPEAEGLEVAVLGSFNPAIFHPEWFLRYKLIGENDAKEAEVNVVGSEVTDIQICGIKLVCIKDRFSLGIANISHAARMQDLLLQIFTLLPHIPVTACGINPSVHFKISDTQYWHKIGHTLAPKELIWNDLKQLEKPGMRSLNITALRTGEFPGQTNITVEPSLRFPPGLFVQSNYHYPVPAEAIHTTAVELVLKFLKEEWNPACAMARIVANKIFEKIKPD